MLKMRMLSQLRPFKEAKRDEDGNIILDKNGNILYQITTLIVHHNPSYFPKRYAEKPTC